jgi:HSP20 family protein
MRLIKFQRPNLSNWSGFDQLSDLHEEFNRLFNEPFERTARAFGALNAWAPPVDIYEDKNSLILRVEVPGLKKEDIDISLHENVLTISGERKNEKKYEGARTSREERFFGRFMRSMKLHKPVDPNQVKAQYEDGILTVTLPKAEEAKPRQIEIKGV